MVTNWLNAGKKIIIYQNKSIISAALIITLMSGISSVLGLLRNRMLLARFFETPQLQFQLDAYWVAFRLPELIFQLLVMGALSAAFIPIYTKFLKKDEAEANRMTSAMINLMVVVFGIFSILIFIFAEYLINLMTHDNFTATQVVLAANLTRIMILAQLFFAVSNFMSGMLQAHQRFVIPALAPVFYNLGIMLGIYFLTPYFSIYGAAIGVVIGALFHLLLQWPIAKKVGFKYQLIWQPKHTGLKEMIKLMPPRAMAIGVSQFELFASVFFATALSSGSLTIFNIAQALMSAPIRIISVPMGQASLPFLAKEAMPETIDNFKNVFMQSLNQIMFLTLPASSLLLVLRIPLVRLAYGAAEFPWAATLLTGKMVAILALSLFAQGGLHIVTRAFYALHNTKTPFIVGLIAVLINVGLATWFTFGLRMDVKGLAVAMTAAVVTDFLLSFYLLNKQVKGMPWSAYMPSIIKMVVAAVLMGVALWVPLRLLDKFVFDTTHVLPLTLLTGVVTIIGMAVYMLLTYIMKVPELNNILGILNKMGNWRGVLKQSEEVLDVPPTQTSELKP